jgi:O-succinylbenzoic acid--CoA ligase
MFIIDFSSSKEDILKSISNRNDPEWAIPVFDFIRSWLDEKINLFEVKTSGSTGLPKVIFHSRDAMIASAERTCDFFQLKKGDTALLALPATHIGGKMMIVRSAIRGLKMICVEPRSNPFTNLKYDEEITFAAFTPMQMSTILDDSAETSHDLSLPLTNLSSIHKIILGGGEVSYSLKQKLQDIFASVYETYGMTETISHIALKKINGVDKSDYFTLLDGVKITIDERGCLLIEAPYLSVTTLYTNDIVKIISEKEFQWLGRYDNIINTGGIKVSAEEIERKLQPYIDANFFIAGIADDILGQKVILVLENETSKNGLQKNYAEVLSKYEKPRQVVSISQFSYTENGKINKKETLKRIATQ